MIAVVKVIVFIRSGFSGHSQPYIGQKGVLIDKRNNSKNDSLIHILIRLGLNCYSFIQGTSDP
jgi:hypothetical protein